MSNNNSISPFKVVCVDHPCFSKEWRCYLTKRVVDGPQINEVVTVLKELPTGYKLKEYIDEDEMGFDKKFFALAQETYSDATAAVLEKFPITEGGQVDKVLIPEKVNN